MTWLFIIGGLKRVGSLLGKLNVYQLALLAVSLFALVQHFQLAGERRHSAKVEAARAADRLAYQQAQADAKAKNDATIKRVEHEQEAITDRVKSDYARDLERLRRKAAQGNAGGTKAPGDGKAAGGTGEADPVRLPPERLLRAREIELQLKYLIDWVNGQSKVDPN